MEAHEGILLGLDKKLEWLICMSLEKLSRPPAKVYPFELDTFQKDAIACIERDESVLVAGTKWSSVSLHWHDIDRSSYVCWKDCGSGICYRGSEIIREVAWVIYDEVHYMRDKERGVVWEESIILLPHKVRFVFLSATIPNSKEFVSWVSKIHRQPCHVVYTEYRPTPLQHYVFPAGSEGLFLVVDEKRTFREENFQKAMSILQPSPADEVSGDNKKKNRNKSLNADLFKIVRLIMDRELDPCIIFSFSKKDCETYALQMAR